MTRSEQIQAGALAAWRASFSAEPREPLDVRGGALDPNAWCMKFATAVLDGAPLPPLDKDTEIPAGHPTLIATEDAMGVVYTPASSRKDAE